MTSDDVFVRVAEDVEGGALLGVWVVPPGEGPRATNVYDQRAYMVGGYDGVDPGSLDGRPAGRLMGYDGQRTFRTLCTTDRVLRAVYAQDGQVYAGGDGGRIVVWNRSMQPGPGTPCRTLDAASGLDPSISIRGIAGSRRRPLEVWFAGGAPAGASPRAALLRYDGTDLKPIEVPAEAQDKMLNGVAYYDQWGFWVVGDRGTLLNRAPDQEVWTPQPAPQPALGSDDRLCSVSVVPEANGYFTMVVGGDQIGRVLARGKSRDLWETRQYGELADIPALRGVFAARELEVYMVGRHGAIAVLTGSAGSAGGAIYRQPRPLTSKTLLAVHGGTLGQMQGDTLVMAVGGDSDNHTTDQRAVILMRDSGLLPEYIVDGTPQQSYGSARPELGGGGMQ